MQTVTRARKNDKAEGIEKSSSFPQISAEKPKTCPYDYLAKDGLIEYNGVTFVCDYKTNSICLGDMSNEKNVLNISLPSGGNLKVNVNNFGDLAKAAGMFSPGTPTTVASIQEKSINGSVTPSSKFAAMLVREVNAT